ncbi:DUF3054 domain-containing protein [Halegenticoccus soli]|uniref:DUF3054 domain-containing protein n=1 Tax=Halegenticoccus soli TaxID=1985678 RepID=UPI000C6D531B|nr:DUF3054 domain-containing protein [Halegenticoccus soli]
MANPVASVLEQRVDRGTLPLAVGDVLVIAALLTFGTINHSSVDFVVGNPLYLLGVIAPFLIGWVLVAPLVGAYSAGAGESAKASVPLVIRSWVPADLVGVGLRATPLFEGGAALTFVAVTLVAGIVGLGAWRYLAFAVR